MRMEDMVLVSVDDHAVEPRDMFERHVPAAYRGLAPRCVRVGTRDRWVFEDSFVPMIGMNAVAGRPRHEYGMEAGSFDEMREAAWNVHRRVEDMDANGVLGSLCFPSLPGFAGHTFLKYKDRTAALAVVRAYNDWHFEDWCGAYPDRFIPMALLPLWDGALAAAEMERMARRGVHAVTFPDNPAAWGLPSIHSPEWAPLWKVCADHDVMICCHIGSGAGAPHASDDTPIEAWILSMPMSIANSAADWLHARIWQQYPDLKMSLSEGGIGWIPYFLERADITHQRHREWSHCDFAGKAPSQVFREHFVTCFIDETFGPRNVAEIGEDMITWECDYPHADTTWPEAPEFLWGAVKAMPDKVIDKLTHQNAMRLYRFDPFAGRPREDCTVGALRARAGGVDTRTQAMAPGVKPGEAGRRVTSGDVNRMLADMAGQP
ncbi:MAG: hypothetical protein JWQ29_2907 [Phenylobacterium sp.]|nr:hypothetical protein [Phenylobacterium sp.]